MTENTELVAEATVQKISKGGSETVEHTTPATILGHDNVKGWLDVAAKKNMPTLLVGDTGTGKTSIVREVAHGRGQQLVRFNMTGETTVDDFVGKFTLNNGSTEWQDGILIQAMRNGHWLVCDEVNVALPEILTVLQSLLDDDRFVVLAQKDGEIVRAHEDFRFFATMNPVDEYAGTKDLNKAFKSRFGLIINMGYPNAETETEIVQSRTGVSGDDASKMVDTAIEIRKAKAEGELFYTCSTRDLLQWGELVTDLGIDTAFELTVLNKANGDRTRVAEAYAKVSGTYIDLATNKVITNYEVLQQENQKLDRKRRAFNRKKAEMIRQVKEELIERFLSTPDAMEADVKKQDTSLTTDDIVNVVDDTATEPEKAPTE